MESIELEVPTGDVLNGIIVAVAIEPLHARVRIHGTTKAGASIWIEAQGSQSQLELPFVNGSVKVEHLDPFDAFSIIALGWRDRRDI